MGVRCNSSFAGMRSRLSALALAGLGLGACSSALAQAASPQAARPEGTPLAWVQAAVDNELKIISPEGLPAVRFRERKTDARGDTTREYMETQEGTVARLVERNGQPLTAAEDAGERQRLQDLIDSPADFAKHHAHDKSQRADASQLVRLLPQAMLYSYAPGQPQPEGAKSPQVVIDYKPNPEFHPPTTRAELLTGIEGRVWIDARSRRMTRIEGDVLRPVDFGYGLVARIFPGGKIMLEQTDAGGDRWVYSRLSEHIQVRVLLVKNLVQSTEASSWDFRLLPSHPHYQDAIKQLLAMQIPLRP
jgi:hypothetical protein